MDEKGVEFDVLEFVKEIAPEMDLEQINIEELRLQKETIREMVEFSREMELTEEERHAVEFLQDVLEVMEMELGEEIDEVDFVLETETLEVGMGDIIQDDLVDTVEGLPTGEFHNTDYDKLLESIRGCKANEYQIKCEAAAKEWQESKKGKSRSISMDRGR